LERTNFLLRYCFPSADSWARDYVDSFVRVVVVVVVDIADSLVVVDGDAARTRGKWEEEKVVRKHVIIKRKAHAQLSFV